MTTLNYLKNNNRQTKTTFIKTLWSKLDFRLFSTYSTVVQCLFTYFIIFTCFVGTVLIRLSGHVLLVVLSLLLHSLEIYKKKINKYNLYNVW